MSLQTFDDPQNRSAYGTDWSVKVYAHTARQGLTVPEIQCFDMIPQTHRGSILDIGVGAGRTVEGLRKLFKQYVAFDYSPSLVKKAQELYPDAHIQQGDARHFSFSDPFDCILFSFNGIDSVSYEDRWIIFENIYRHLKPGGYFIYSSHNLHHHRVNDWANHLFVRELIMPLKNIRFFANRWRNFISGLSTDPKRWRLINDPGLGFSLKLVYACVPEEMELLAQKGFDVVGSIGNTKTHMGYDEQDCWVYNVLQKKS
jgi:SAM-dependent methyltransferase